MKYEEMIKKAIEELKNDGELFVDMVNELDSWNGFADGFRAYQMYEIDELFCDCKVSEFLDKLGRNFDHNDEYFIDSVYGLESTDDIEDHYRDNVDEGELLDSIIENYYNITISDSDFDELIESIVNHDEENA